MALYAGVDLHSNNNYLGILNEEGKRIHRKKLNNNLEEILEEFEPYRTDLAGIVVESTYNWYWYVDGLHDNGYDNVHLANPCAIKQYEGLKHSDDNKDAFHLANLLRLGILPEGYIYPVEERGIRDLLRKRLLLVRHRTAHILSFKNLVSRRTGGNVTANMVKSLEEKDVEMYLTNKYENQSGSANIAIIRALNKEITKIENAVKAEGKLREEYEVLLTIKGVGPVLGLTIMYETGEIGRFKNVGNYASYCRCVESKRISNDKKKGHGNRKNGNRYLGWAYIEAANFLIRFNEIARKYYQRKLAKTNKLVALKTVAHKRSRACYHMIKEGRSFDIERVFRK